VRAGPRRDHATLTPEPTASDWKVGDRVADMAMTGGYAHHRLLEAARLARVPDLVASLGATPIDYQKEDFTKVVPEGFDVVFDGIGESGFTKSWSAVKKGGFLSAYGFQAGVQSNAAFLTIGMWIGRIYLWNALPNGKRAGFYSITSTRKSHPDWFKEDLSKLLGLLESGKLSPRIAERLRLEDVADAHRRLESGGLDGKLVIDPSVR